MPDLIYLAVPYTHKSKRVMQYRFSVVTKVAVVLAETSGCLVFSPITHAYPIHRHNKKNTYEYWLGLDFKILDISDWLYILTLDGWQESVGVKKERGRFALKEFVTVPFHGWDRIKLIDPKSYL